MATKAGQEAWQTIADLFFNGEMHDRFHAASAAIGVSPGLLKGLLMLDAQVGVPMRELAGTIGCDASYVTTLADGLEEHGYAMRRAHPTDRRVKTLVLTGRGVSAREKALAVLHEPPRSFGALTATEQRQLRDLLTKVAAADPELSSRAARSA